jgi:hypothetical protein
MTVHHDTFLEIRALEDRLANPAPGATREQLALLFVPEFREVGSSGRVYDTEATLASFQGGGHSIVLLEGFRVERLAQHVLLATYVARAAAGPGWRPPTVRSSIWRERQGAWQIVFHQGTRMEEGR